VRALFEITDFTKDIIERSAGVPVLVDFWAEWCAPCRALGPVLEKLAAEANGRWVLAKVDTERNQSIAAQYGIRSIPSVKLFVDGAVVNEFRGALPESAVRQWLDKALPDPHGKDIERAQVLLKSGKTAEGQEVLQNVLQHDLSNHHARVLLAGTYLGSAPAKSEELVKDIEEDSRHFQMADAIRTFAGLTKKLESAEQLPDRHVKATYIEALRALARGDYETSLDCFIRVIREDRYYDDDGARKACIAIFKVLGEDNDTTRNFRRAFSSALYV
jgi:putative thioredoxin